ncbi:MAG: hypothetical protein GC171_14810 [Terrimonas sp.]|nr:hypothetical protein [Terrimonas sp.]
MKIARHFKEFLEKKGYLEIPSIGRFEVSTEQMSMPKGEVLTRKKLFFSPQNKPAFDESLVQFLCEKLRSEACVVYADIRSFSYYLNELLIQGLEAELPGIGFLNRNNTNEVEFSYQSTYIRRERPQKKIAAYLMNYWM